MKVSKNAAKKARRLARAKENRLRTDAATAAASTSSAQAATTPAQDTNAQSSATITVVHTTTTEINLESTGPMEPAVVVAQTKLYCEAASVSASASAPKQTGSSSTGVSAMSAEPVFRTLGPDGPYRDEIVE